MATSLKKTAWANNNHLKPLPLMLKPTGCFVLDRTPAPVSADRPLLINDARVEGAQIGVHGADSRRTDAVLAR